MHRSSARVAPDPGHHSALSKRAAKRTAPEDGAINQDQWRGGSDQYYQYLLLTRTYIYMYVYISVYNVYMYIYMNIYIYIYPCRHTTHTQYYQYIFCFGTHTHTHICTHAHTHAHTHRRHHAGMDPKSSVANIRQVSSSLLAIARGICHSGLFCVCVRERERERERLDYIQES